MRIIDALKFPLLLRRFIRIAGSIDERLAEQNLYLKRLADKFAPDVEVVPVEAKVSSVDFSEQEFQARVQEFSEKIQQDLHREPTEEEIADFLDGIPVGMK